MSVGLAIIAKNEELKLPSLLASVAGAFDRVVLVDTGSGDKTKDVFIEWAANEGDANPGFTYDAYDFEWINDFSAARTFADSKLDTDWNAWADCDDVIRGADKLRDIAANAPAEAAAVIFGYDYAQHPETGQCICRLMRERLVRRGMGTWTGRVHEAQQVQGGGVQIVPDEVVLWVHQKQALDPEAAAWSNKRNLKILQVWEKDEPENPRVLAYLAKETAARGHHKKALGFYKRYFKLDVGWNEERAQVFRFAARSMFAVNAPLDDIESLAMEAMRFYPRWPDSWLTLSEVAALRGNQEDSIFYAKHVLALGNPASSMLILNPLDYVSYPHRLIATALGALGKFDEAIESAETAMQLGGADGFLRDCRMAWKHGAKREHTQQTICMMAEQLIAHDEQLKALTLLEECVPYFATDHPRVVALRIFLRQRLAWVNDPAAFAEHYETGGSKPEDFHDDETCDKIAQALPRVGYLIENLEEQHA